MTKLASIPAALAVAALLATAAAAQTPPSPYNITAMGLVHRTPAMANARVVRDLVVAGQGDTALHADVYLPPGGKAGVLRPAVVFVNGVGDRPGNKVKDWAIYRDWARAVTARGMIGVLHESRSGTVANDIASVFRYLDQHGREQGIDPARIGLYASSANVSAALPYAMGEPIRGLRCAAIYYGSVGVPRLRNDLPVFYVKAEHDGPQLNQGIDRTWAAARDSMLPWVMVLGRGLPHAFDALDDSELSRAIVQQTLDFWAANLLPLPPPQAPSDYRTVNAHIYGLDYGAAAALLEKRRSAGETDPEAGRLLLMSYQRSGNFDKGIPLAEELIRAHPDVAGYRSSLGAMLNARQSYVQAAASLEQAVALGAVDVFTNNQLMIALLKSDQIDKAIRYGEQAVARMPMASGQHYNLACAYVRKGDRDRAIASLQTAVARGWNDRTSMAEDEDLAPLRGDPRFEALLKSMQS